MTDTQKDKHMDIANLAQRADSLKMTVGEKCRYHKYLSGWEGGEVDGLTSDNKPKVGQPYFSQYSHVSSLALCLKSFKDYTSIEGLTLVKCL